MALPGAASSSSAKHCPALPGVPSALPPPMAAASPHAIASAGANQSAKPKADVLRGCHTQRFYGSCHTQWTEATPKGYENPGECCASRHAIPSAEANPAAKPKADVLWGLPYATECGNADGLREPKGTLRQRQPNGETPCRRQRQRAVRRGEPFRLRSALRARTPVDAQCPGRRGMHATAVSLAQRSTTAPLDRGVGG